MELAQVTSIFNSNVVEKNFRDSRMISTPEDLQSRKGRRPNIDAMRIILQNWWTPENIPETQISASSKASYRWMVRKYLKGGKTTLSDKQIPLIEEYRDFITTQPEEVVANPKKLGKVVTKTNEAKTDKKAKDIKTDKNFFIPAEFIKYIKDLGVKEFTLKF